MGVKKGLTPLRVHYKGVSYFAFPLLNRLLIDGSKGRLNADMLLVLCSIASYGVNGCTTRVIMLSLYGYADADTLRRLNNRIVLLVKRGLVVRDNKMLFISVHAEKLLSGKL